MFRQYTLHDLRGCAELFRAAFAAEPWNEEWSLRLAETRIAELTGTPNSAGWVSEQDGKMTALLIGRRLTYLTGAEFMIDEFCVSPEMQRTGIGSKMLHHIITELSAEGIVRIVLLTTKGFPSEKFYLKNGFQQEAGMIFMQKPLP
ncbi:MAG: GNAT family N-acetyltransferase [Oscillospiraceae bacterium]|nr:GNAT family N-acetyltransferase [Oscillospiraceae bacterium]